MLRHSLLARALLVPLALSASWAAAPARAWTEAQVQSAHAHVEVSPSGTLEARLQLAVHVHGGWLEGLDIAGLDPELTLLPGEDIVLLESGGQRFRPTVDAAQPGTIALSFRRRDAPRRGDYALAVAYRAELAESAVQAIDGERTRYEWILPGWRSGLDDVRVELIAPAGAEPDEEARVGDSMVTREVDTLPDGRVRLRYVRAHLPRTVPFRVAFTLPNAAVPPSRRAPAVGLPLEPTAWATVRERALDPTFALLSAFFACVALAKLLLHRRTARGLGLLPVGLVPLPPFARAAAVVFFAALAPFLYVLRTDLGVLCLLPVVLLVLERAPRVGRAPGLGAYAPVGPRERLWAAARARIERFGPARWLDASTLPGLGSLLGMVLALVAVDRFVVADAPRYVPPGYATVLHALVPLAALMLTNTRAQLPSSVAERVCALVALARRFPAQLGNVPAALQLVLHRDAAGHGQDARLRLVTEHRARGLVRLDVAIADCRRMGRYVREPVLLVVTREDSDAELRLASALPAVPFRSAPGGRRARTLPLSRVAAVIDTLCLAPAPSVSSVGVLGPVRERPIACVSTRA